MKGKTMTDREKLVDLLWQCVDLDTPFGEIADYLLSNGVRLEPKQATSDENKRWIPVFERLPRPNKLVLCWWESGNGEKEHYGFATFQSHGVWYVSNEGMPKVTHWMPLPEPPIKENT